MIIIHTYSINMIENIFNNTKKAGFFIIVKAMYILKTSFYFNKSFVIYYHNTFQ